jgi:calcineurin-like phosphoesterase family protein
MSILIISDTHIGHKNILTYCPWRKTWASSIDEMDAKIIEEWNKVVAPEDTVYHLGDVAFAKEGNKPTRFAELRKSLNGSINLAVGNHDHSVAKMIKYGYRAANVFELEHNGELITMRHSPWEFSPAEVTTAAILLHGHSHGRKLSQIYGSDSYKLFDVGIDAVHSIRPLTIDEVVSLHRKIICQKNSQNSS